MRRGLAIFALVALGWTGQAALPAEAASQEAARASALRISLAGGQKMLAQRMAMAACYAAIGLDPARHLEMMDRARARFDATLGTLRNGDVRRGLTAETDDRVLTALAEVGLVWRDYERIVEQAVGQGVVTEAQLERIAELNLPVLERMARAAQLVERTHAGRGMSVSEAVSLGLAERQRMLSQKMAKELCLVARGVAPEAHRAALGESVTLFGATLGALREGAPDLGIRRPEAPALEDALAEAAAVWSTLGPLLAEVADGGVAGPTELVTVAAENDRLLAALDRAVALYAGEAPGRP